MSAPLACNCPQGFVPTPDGSQCVQVQTQPPLPLGQGDVIYKTCAGVDNAVYGAFGANFYPNISALPFPIYIAGANHYFQDNANVHLVPTINTGVSTLWGNGNVGVGRLNVAGVWAGDASCNPIHNCGTPADACPLNEWIGFTVCIDIPVAATYCIGVAADNGARVTLNGVTVINVTPNSGNTFTFNYWHVFPIDLPAGKTILHLEGLNTNKVASFAAEIYDATPAQLASFTTIAQLTPTIVFSTLSRIGTSFDTGNPSGYQCPAGYYLSNCGGLACTKISYAQCGPCFQLIDCKNPQNIKIIDADPSLNMLSHIGKVITISSLGTTCWSVSVAESCQNTIHIPGTDAIIVFDTCLLCDPPVCYLLIDCKGVISPYLIQGDLSTYVGQVVKISNLGTTCWNVTLSGTCDGATPLDPTATIQSFGTCLECDPICYLLTDCTGTHSPVTVTNNLSSHSGKIVKIDTFGETCWSVQLAANCNGSVTISDTAVITEFIDCCTCIAKPCYQLVSCIGNPLSPIITKTDLSAFVGKTVNQLVVPNLVIDPTECWTISLFGPCVCPIVAPDVTFNTRAYDDCECCNVPPPPPLPVLPLRVIPKPVKNFTRIEMSKCEIDANINFCQSYWNLTKKHRFGITTCEWNKDFKELWVKKQLVDIAAATSPLFCIHKEVHCVAPQHISKHPANCQCEIHRHGNHHHHVNPCNDPARRGECREQSPYQCMTCAPNACNCGSHGNRGMQHPGGCGCNRCKPSFAGMPCRDEEPTQVFLMWSDYGIMLWEDQNGILTD